jgi:photosystem II stability/assembly factor-like uncharacterized protein
MGLLKKVIFFILIISFATNVIAWEKIRQTDFPVSLYDVFSVGDQVWVAGAKGAFGVSNDGGETFEFVDTPAFEAETGFYEYIYSISFCAENHGIAVGKDGIAFITENGTDWETLSEIQNAFGNDEIFSVDFHADGKAWVAGDNGMIWYSEDFGETWVEQISNVTNNIYDVTVNDEGLGFLVGSDGSANITWIRKTTDFGESWFDTEATFSGATHLNDVVINDGVVIVCGNDGYIAKSEDFGVTFTQLAVGLTDNDFESITVNGDLGFAVGENATILKTNDNWNTIELIENNYRDGFNAITFNQDNEIITCGANGNICKSDYSATVWAEKAVPAYVLWGGFMLDEDNWFFVGENQTLIKTEDAGNSFERMNVGEFEQVLRDVVFFDENTGIVAASNDGLYYRTTDGGLNWEAMEAPLNTIESIEKISPTEAYLIGQGAIYYTSDQGLNWEGFGENYSLVDCFKKDNGDVIFVGENGEVVYYDGSWNSYTLCTSLLTGVTFSDDNTGVIVTLDGTSYYTLNGGSSAEDWTQSNFEGTDELMDVIVDVNGNFIAAGFANNGYNQGVDNAIIISEDNGLNWQMVDIEQPAFVPTRFIDILSYENKYVALGAYQLIYSHTDIQYGNLSGSVSLSGGAGNIEDVEILVGDIVVNPEAGGDFSVDLEVGTYTLTANLDGYDEFSTELEINANETTEIDIELNETIMYATISLTVELNGGTGNINDVTVTIDDVEYTQDSEGHFIIELPFGDYNFEVSLEGYVTWNEVVTVDTEDIIELLAVLEPEEFTGDSLILGEITNYPNPFNPTTTIFFDLAIGQNVKLEIFNNKGQKIKQLVNNRISAGKHSVIWNGTDTGDKAVASGIYFYRLTISDKVFNRKMLLMK